MKKRKLVCLLAMITCLSLPLAACDKDEEPASNELNKHFYWEDPRTAYSQVVRYDGEMYDVDHEHDLAVIYSSENKSNGTTEDKYQVVDMLSGKVIREETVSNAVGSWTNTLDVKINYPLIEVNRSTEWLDGSYTYSYSAYLARESYTDDNGTYWDNALVAGSSDYSSASVENHYSLYEIEVGDKVYWVNEDLQLLREFKSEQTSGYSTPEFDASYGDYLYSWEFSETSRVIQVFNREGVCSMQYTFPSDVVSLGALDEPVVLNNGNILVQEYALADDAATDYTLKQMVMDPLTSEPKMQKMNLTSKVIDYKTGEVKELALDYVVYDLEAAYTSEYGDFPIWVRESAQNQAFIAKIVNRETTTLDYVTLDNEGKITYTVKNDYLKGQSSAMYGENAWTNIGDGYWSDKYYTAEVFVDASFQDWIFDLDGNKVGVLPMTWDWDAYYEQYNCGITDKYIVTPYGVYDYNQNCLYDFMTSKFVESEYRSDMMGSSTDVPYQITVTKQEIYLTALNRKTLDLEIYKFNGEDFVRITDEKIEIEYNDYGLPAGNKITLSANVGKIYEMNNQATWTLYGADGNPLLKMQAESPYILKYCNNVAYTETETLDGSPIVYVVK